MPLPVLMNSPEFSISYSDLSCIIVLVCLYSRVIFMVRTLRWGVVLKNGLTSLLGRAIIRCAMAQKPDNSTSSDDGTITEEEFKTYPKHSETFETYFYLGEKRSLRECALIRFRNLVPDITVTDPRFPTKFTSFYMKIKRWARKEGWNTWVKRKEWEDRQAGAKDKTSKIMKTTQSVQTYRTVLQQAVFVFAKKAARSMKLVTETMKIEELLDEGGLSPMKKVELEKRLDLLNTRISESDIRIKSLKEARECMALEVELGKVIDNLPETGPEGKDKLPEKDAEKVDAVMEFFRRHAKDSSRQAEKDEASSSVISNEN
jgi:hypothetical protein